MTEKATGITQTAMERKLEFKDIAGYLPHDLKSIGTYGVSNVRGCTYRDIIHCPESEIEATRTKMKFIKPILHPLSDLYRTITHNGKEVVPIVELAKIAVDYPYLKWEFKNNGAGASNYFVAYDEKEKHLFIRLHGISCYCKNDYKIIDFLNELKIDYRGLIGAGLAIDCNTLETNPYK